MSLDVYLIAKEPITKKGTGVFVRENGTSRELTFEEILKKWPEATVEETEEQTTQVFHLNITHNLVKMAEAAGLYEAMWRPYKLMQGYHESDNYEAESLFEENQVIEAKMLIPFLKTGIAKLLAKPSDFTIFEPNNGWGTFIQLVNTAKDYLEACEKYLEAQVITSR
jgi:hypothetical protein